MEMADTTTTTNTTNTTVKKVKKSCPPIIPKRDEGTFLEIIRGLAATLTTLADNTVKIDAHLEERASQDEEDRKLIRLLIENQQKNYEKVLDWVIRAGMIAVLVATGGNWLGVW